MIRTLTLIWEIVFVWTEVTSIQRLFFYYIRARLVTCLFIPIFIEFTRQHSKALAFICQIQLFLGFYLTRASLFDNPKAYLTTSQLSKTNWRSVVKINFFKKAKSWVNKQQWIQLTDLLFFFRRAALWTSETNNRSHWKQNAVCPLYRFLSLACSKERLTTRMHSRPIKPELATCGMRSHHRGKEEKAATPRNFNHRNKSTLNFFSANQP